MAWILVGFEIGIGLALTVFVLVILALACELYDQDAWEAAQRMQREREAASREAERKQWEEFRAANPHGGPWW